MYSVVLQWLRELDEEPGNLRVDVTVEIWGTVCAPVAALAVYIPLMSVVTTSVLYETNTRHTVKLHAV